MSALLATTIFSNTVSESEGLIPFNPTKLPKFIASCAIQSDPRIKPNNGMQAFENLEQVCEYLDSSHNQSHYSDRLKKVLFETALERLCIGIDIKSCKADIKTTNLCRRSKGKEQNFVMKYLMDLTFEGLP